MPPRAQPAKPKRDLAVIGALGVIPAAPIHVVTPAFEGSLAALFSLVRDHRVDLLDVPLFPICEAYFAYLITATESNLDEAAVALSALAYLLERKAWFLLPSLEPEPEAFEEPAELEAPTVAEFRAAIDTLAHWHDERADLFFRSADAGPSPFELPYELSNVAPTDLARAFDRILSRAVATPMPILSRPRRSLAEQMGIVLAALSAEFCSLDALMNQPLSRSECVYWFLSILELVRLGKVRLRAREEIIELALAVAPQAVLWSPETIHA